MNFQIELSRLTMHVAQNVNGNAIHPPSGLKERAADFSFQGVEYFQCFTKDDQRQYTPCSRDDSQPWSDMVTVQLYRNARNVDSLAATAATVLANYKKASGIIVKTAASAPNSGREHVNEPSDKFTQHLIVVIFGRPECIEAVFSRFGMHDGVGAAVLYSHRIYGKSVGDEMAAWLMENRSAIERNLMNWSTMPRFSRSSIDRH